MVFPVEHPVDPSRAISLSTGYRPPTAGAPSSRPSPQLKMRSESLVGNPLLRSTISPQREEPGPVLSKPRQKNALAGRWPQPIQPDSAGLPTLSRLSAIAGRKRPDRPIEIACRSGKTRPDLARGPRGDPKEPPGACGIARISRTRAIPAQSLRPQEDWETASSYSGAPSGTTSTCR